MVVVVTGTTLLVVGVSTELVPNPVFGRAIASIGQAYALLLVIAVLSGPRVRESVRFAARVRESVRSSARIRGHDADLGVSTGPRVRLLRLLPA